MDKKIYNISLLRLLCVISIVLTHIFLYYDNYLYTWLNIAVQVFLFMSGYLYGMKNINNSKKWLIKQIKKLSLVYYPYIFIIIIIYFIFFRDLLSIKKILINLFNLQGFVDGLDNLSHLWFLTYILICYILTPLIYKMLSKLKNTSTLKYFSIVILFCLLLQIITIPLIFLLKYKQSYVSCYIFAYALSYKYNDKILTSEKQKVENIIILVSLLMIFLKLFIEIKLFPYAFSYQYKILSLIIQYTKVIIASGIFLLFTKIIKVRNNHLQNILKHTDQYTFEIYIVHHIFIIGSLSLMNYNIAIIILLIILSAILLKYIENKIKRIFI